MTAETHAVPLDPTPESGASGALRRALAGATGVLTLLLGYWLVTTVPVLTSESGSEAWSYLAGGVAVSVAVAALLAAVTLPMDVLSRSWPRSRALLLFAGTGAFAMGVVFFAMSREYPGENLFVAFLIPGIVIGAVLGAAVLGAVELVSHRPRLFVACAAASAVAVVIGAVSLLQR